MLVKIQETAGEIVTDIAAVAGTNDAPLLAPAVASGLAPNRRTPQMWA